MKRIAVEIISTGMVSATGFFAKRQVTRALNHLILKNDKEKKPESPRSLTQPMRPPSVR